LSAGIIGVETDGVDLVALTLVALAAPAVLVALVALTAPAAFETITTTNFFESMLQSLILVSSLSIFPVYLLKTSINNNKILYILIVIYIMLKISKTNRHKSTFGFLPNIQILFQLGVFPLIVAPKNLKFIKLIVVFFTIYILNIYIYKRQKLFETD